MKKLIAISVVALMTLAASALSHADVMETSKEIIVVFNVVEMFGMEIWDDDYSQTLPDVIPGDGAVGDIHIYATSNHGRQWYINGETLGIAGQTQPLPDTLPVEITTFDGITGGPDAGTATAPTGLFVSDLELTSTPTPIYTAAAPEFSIRGLQIGCVFVVPTEFDTKNDLYEGTVVLTMTE